MEVPITEQYGPAKVRVKFGDDIDGDIVPISIDYTFEFSDRRFFHFVVVLDEAGFRLYRLGKLEYLKARFYEKRPNLPEPYRSSSEMEAMLKDFERFIDDYGEAIIDRAEALGLI